MERGEEGCCELKDFSVEIVYDVYFDVDFRLAVVEAVSGRR